ncbi:MAG: gamma-glutamyltransferase family protein [Gammaproteobacteria bacterium]|nr:gamma-glutamyltransferase family protein [Gammaproteobacteria bacterium]
MSSVAVATSSQLAADAAQEVAADGGNAVDCALAASLLTMNTEPGVCALAGSAFITIWPAGNDPVTIDGNVSVPGKGLADDERRGGAVSVSMEYGGGVETLVGTGSVAVPGSLAALQHAWKRYGSAHWGSIFAPSIRAVRDGFPLPSACRYYLGYSGDSVFGRSVDGHTALHRADGTLCDSGEAIRIPHLADTLTAIAAEGAELFYQGELADRISDHCRAGGGAMTKLDLTSYQAIERRPLMADMGNWRIATNPPPAVGGAVLAAMLMACRDIEGTAWNREQLHKLIESQRACLDFRKRNLDLAEDVGAEAAKLIAAATSGRLLSRWSSASTVHTSVVDDNGMGCAITASSGYGSGEMPAGTGLWLNNCLGEIELNRRGLDAGPPGARLPSNMAPCVARNGDAVLAAGSPGADRITTALQQFLINHLQFQMPLQKAIAHPRVHIDTSGMDVRLMAEPGFDLPVTDLPVHEYEELVMYFGGVGAAVLSDDNELACAADPRREGGTCIYRG